ncbi:hypothetical protein [Sphingomonas jatrophae]|uniref:Uncharacterized protein n=1 Tax=Sphingomonas jatrophae TaxID=1166337 RepID=A0A1I6JXA6_9SPHN|nr:hypothetical protein [Sphingomonas jatrophae]SFR83581.1 hypothetical protein SAMN05192580_1028 [Sphingomonas jatrophae]
MYSELTYFEGAHFQHIADYQEQLRLKWRSPSSAADAGARSSGLAAAGRVRTAPSLRADSARQS